jgi:hypothetical protein
LEVLTAPAAPKQNSRMAAILMATMVVLVRALSRTPRTSTQLTSRVMISAGTLNQPAGPPDAGKGGKAHRAGK